jgi:hypothetical protein
VESGNDKKKLGNRVTGARFQFPISNFQLLPTTIQIRSKLSNYEKSKNLEKKQ